MINPFAKARYRPVSGDSVVTPAADQRRRRSIIVAILAIAIVFIVIIVFATVGTVKNNNKIQQITKNVQQTTTATTATGSRIIKQDGDWLLVQSDSSDAGSVLSIFRENTHGQLTLIVGPGTSFNPLQLLMNNIPASIQAAATGQTLAQAQQNIKDFANGTYLADQANNGQIGAPPIKGLDGFATAGMGNDLLQYGVASQLATYFANINTHGNWQNLNGAQPTSPKQQIADVTISGITATTLADYATSQYTGTITTLSGDNATTTYTLTVTTILTNSTATTPAQINLATITIANTDGTNPTAIYDYATGIVVPVAEN